MLLLTGANGQLGTAVARLFPDALCPASDVLDIASAESVQAYVAAHPVSAIVNCAAHTAVDQAEDEPDAAFAVNAQGPENLAKTGIPVLHISTDYVFDGARPVPYTEEDLTNPLSVYGRSKLAGEHALLDHASACAILRTSWVYSETRKNFLKTMHSLMQDHDVLLVIYDQIGTPTYADDLAEAIAALLTTLKDSGGKEIYHYSAEGSCSWYDFAEAIARATHARCRIEPVASKDYPAKALRPHYSVLNKSKIKEKTGLHIPHWTEGLEKCLKKYL